MVYISLEPSTICCPFCTHWFNLRLPSENVKINCPRGSQIFYGIIYTRLVSDRGMVTKGPWISVECAIHSYGAALLEFSFVGGLCFLALLPLPSSCQAAHSWLAFSWDHCKKCPQRHAVTCAGARLRSERVPVSLTCRGNTELIPDADTCIPTQRCHPLARVC